MKHDCVEHINKLLVDQNTVIHTAVSLSSDRELIVVSTVKADATKRGKPVKFFATFCPFCGQKLRTE